MSISTVLGSRRWTQQAWPSLTEVTAFVLYFAPKVLTVSFRHISLSDFCIFESHSSMTHYHRLSLQDLLHRLAGQDIPEAKFCLRHILKSKFELMSQHIGTSKASEAYPPAHCTTAAFNSIYRSCSKSRTKTSII